MERVKGIGGVFLYANDAAKLAAWYDDVLGIRTVANDECGNYYTQFEYFDAEDPSRKVSTVFAIFQAPTPLADVRRECRLNFRVGDLAAMAAQFRTKGIEVSKYE